MVNCSNIFAGALTKTALTESQMKPLLLSLVEGLFTKIFASNSACEILRRRSHHCRDSIKATSAVRGLQSLNHSFTTTNEDVHLHHPPSDINQSNLLSKQWLLRQFSFHRFLSRNIISFQNSIRSFSVFHCAIESCGVKLFSVSSHRDS